jgi:ABC-type multidrug transport system permease subunit
VSQEPSKWMDKIIGACFGVLLAVIALYCAVRLLESILPTLIVIIGILALIAALIGAFVVISTWRNRW